MQHEVTWLQEKMLSLAREAHGLGDWQFGEGCLQPTDEMVYDRFGPGFSDTKFNWHVDAGELDPRLVSVVAYFTDPATYQGGDLELKVAPDQVVTRRYLPGAAVAFPSKVLEHRVTPVTRGERRSLLLLCGFRNGTFLNWHY